MSSRLLAGVVNLGNMSGIGPLGNVGGPGQEHYNDAFQRVETLISNVLGLLTIIAGIWFLLQIILAALSWINSGGDKQNIQTAQKKLTHAFIGLFIVVIAYALVGLIAKFLGLNIFDFVITFGSIGA